ncbi:RES family NAD+ phosphorylase [Stappia indica]|uniref:RES family NAD+ phosphorylase n=1 Tax=Stappia indica TaxID=538381 RepID=UPI001CD20B26|nr:RES family NAD+ phosphorylase [Stappia indica]MCA1299392.1 RES family NAD+ phosphorylase [Stappia indica]
MTDRQDIPQTDFTDPDTIRLIATAHIDEPAMAPLADTAEDLAVLEALEGLTSRRRALAMPLPAGLLPEELLTEAHGYGWSYINAAFCYTRTTGNRFNGPERGAWYATFGPNAGPTARAEVAWHLTRELDATGIYDNVTCYRELHAGFTTRMHDLRGFAGAPFLDPDPETAYPAGQTLAQGLRQTGSAGVLYPSARGNQGLCLAAFRPNLVQNIRQGATWCFTWAGERTPAMDRI